jgi:hypothetical protein
LHGRHADLIFHHPPFQGLGFSGTLLVRGYNY